MGAPIPCRNGPAETPSEILGVGEMTQEGSHLAKAFQFLNQGVLAYTGSNR